MKGFKAFKLNNKGVGVVNVVIALSFLSILGLLILALSYTSSEMKSSERVGREVAYNAEGVVEQLRSGVQVAISDSIQDCYNDVMTNYSAYRDSIEDKFDKSFNYSFNKWKPYIVDDEGVKKGYDLDGNTVAFTSGISLFAGDKVFFDTTDAKAYVWNKYNIKALEPFMKAGFGGTAVVSCVDDSGNAIATGYGDALWSYREVTVGDETKQIPEKVTLKNVRVRYQRLLHTVTITTDFVVEFPDLGYVYHEENTDSSFTDFAVVALNQINHRSGKVVVDGNAYAGSVNISATTNSHSFVLKRGGLLISKNDIDVRGQNSNGDYYDSEEQQWYSRANVDATLAAITDETVRERERIKINSAFYITDGSTLWANGINVHQNAYAALCYRENILNDLNLKNTGSTALITGDAYYGFGNSATNPSQSSSIIVNGINTSKANLNLSGLSSMTLAGYSYIDVGGNNVVKMGQSMATKRDQLAYLAPVEMLNYEDFSIKISTNPSVFLYSPENELDIDQYSDFVAQFDAHGGKPLDSVRLWRKNNVDMYPSNYGIKIKPASVPYADHYKIGYFFIEFEEANGYSALENANRYFRDYFENNTEKVNEYTQQYLDFTDSFSVKSAGDTFKVETDPTKPKIGLRAVLKETLGDAYDTFQAFINSINNEVAKKVEAFSNLCITLNEGYGPEKALESDLGTDAQKVQRAAATNPFDYYTLKTTGNVTYIEEALSRAGTDTLTFLNNDGELVAIVTSRALEYSGDSTTVNGTNIGVDTSKLCLILSTADVTIKSDFKGLILTRGSVNVDAGAGIVTLTASSDDVNAAMGAKTSEKDREDFKNSATDEYDLFAVIDGDENMQPESGIMPYEFLFYKYVPAYSESETKDGSYWDVGTLVSFDKWNKENGIGESED